jgi:hypothetical protein
VIEEISTSALPTGIIQAAGAEITHPVQSRRTAGNKGVTAAEMQAGGFSVKQSKSRNMSDEAGFGSLVFSGGEVPEGLQRLQTLVDSRERAPTFLR